MYITGLEKGIYLYAVNDGASITDNSLYNTATSSTQQICIDVESNNGHNISNNNIGGSGPGCTGTWVNNGKTNWWAMYLTLGTVMTPTSIQGNLIKNIHLSDATSTVTSACFYG